MKGWYKALEDLVWLTQLGLNMLLPLVMCLGGCWWAVSHWGWPCGCICPLFCWGLPPGRRTSGSSSKSGSTAPKRTSPAGQALTRIYEIRESYTYEITAGIQKGTAPHRGRHGILHRDHVGAFRGAASGGLGEVRLYGRPRQPRGRSVAIGNFAGICFVVQKIIDEPDEKRRKATLQLSYNSRMLLQALWVVVAVAAPCFQPFASVLPLFFPRVTIYYLQITGKYKPLTPKAEPVDVSVEDDPEPADAQQSAPDEKGGET